MGRYVIRRLIQAIPVLLGATLFIFVIVFALPGDPIAALAGEKRQDPNIVAILRDQYHLNDPVLVQYGYYISNIFLHGDFGKTFAGVPVTQLMAGKFQVTLTWRSSPSSWKRSSASCSVCGRRCAVAGASTP